MECFGSCVCSVPLMLGRCCRRTWWWSAAPPCCQGSSTGSWLRYASWWRNRSTATSWRARASGYTLFQPSPTAPPGSEVRDDVFIILVSEFVENNQCMFGNLIFPVSSLLYRCYIRGTSGHPGQQVCVAGLLQPDGPHSRLVLPELSSSWIPVRSRKDPSSTHEESLFHREVVCEVI